MNTNISSVIILVGGLGSRFSSIEENPKQLSKLNNEYILMHIIKHFKKYGINHFIFPLGFKKQFFSKFFLSNKNIKKYKFNILNKKFKHNQIIKKKINISFFNAGNNTTKMLRIFKSLKYVIGENFMVSYGDDLSNIKINQIIKKFNSNKQKKAVFAIFRNRSQYGHVITKKNGLVKKFIEKPFHQHPINIGNYIFNKKIFKKNISKKGELETDMLQKLAKSKALQTFEHKGYFYSINDKKELNLAKQKIEKFK